MQGDVGILIVIFRYDTISSSDEDDIVSYRNITISTPTSPCICCPYH